MSKVRKFDERAFAAIWFKEPNREQVQDFIDSEIRRAQLEILEKAYDMLDRGNYDALKKEIEEGE